MSSDTFSFRSKIPAPAPLVFDWHLQPGALERLTPPWEPVRVVERSGDVTNGGRVVLETRLGPIPLRWIAVHTTYVPGSLFRDEQLSGPFKKWIHTHRVDPRGDEASELEDSVEYILPFGALGRLLAGRFIRAKLNRLFTYRHHVTRVDCAARFKFEKGSAVKTVALSGSTGLVGTALTPLLTASGLRVLPLVRKKSANIDAILMDAPTNSIESSKLEGIDAVIHLAGETISERWTPAKKKRIRDSRTLTTRLLCENLAKLKRKPAVLLCASAMGIYGDRGDERLTETSTSGQGFLADVCKEWEAATKPAEDAGIRVVHLRFGVILSAKGGALAKMLMPFKLCVGGVLGSGKQYMSWITLEDVLGAIQHALHTPAVRGALNLTAPAPATNREFTKTLGKVLGRPTILPAPAFALRLALGEMADELLLSSMRVEPQKLIETGYTFRFPELEPALRFELGR